MNGDADPCDDPLDLGIVPLFPLPNVVLFPGTILPLHIFEERYKAMTRHALEGDRRIAMALLHPGWEKSYHARPMIDPVVCVGIMLTHECLADGKYNFLLQGVKRARIVAEVGNEPYRLARVRALDELRVAEQDLVTERQRLAALFKDGPLAASCAAPQICRLIKGSLGTAELVDVAVFNFLDEVPLKQMLLSETDVRQRIARALAALEQIDLVPQPLQTSPVRGRAWKLDKPGLN